MCIRDRAAQRSGGLDSERYLCEITLLSLMLTSWLWMLRRRHRTSWGPGAEPVLIAAVMLAVFSTLPLNFTYGYRRAMRKALPGELRLVEHCLRSRIRKEATADLWEHCQLETVNPGQAAREHFRVMARQMPWRQSLLR